MIASCPPTSHGQHHTHFNMFPVSGVIAMFNSPGTQIRRETLCVKRGCKDSSWGHSDCLREALVCFRKPCNCANRSGEKKIHLIETQQFWKKTQVVFFFYAQMRWYFRQFFKKKTLMETLHSHFYRSCDRQHRDMTWCGTWGQRRQLRY